ncbi:hypothetical protein BegalDRAFT_0098 [Beggiatoa alba B18LD]|uniref:Uncharacterized protein n=1 Tax=Beggiatoa alba B18LD TaxID=395493 RepID=I3CBM9_9GAMM|nr:hypothetical protein [Beggiatoa alba]EIJ41022.1 hypothetical protein BegalDRAFT_0098 [Beggiatoa alba B18LD]
MFIRQSMRLLGFLWAFVFLSGCQAEQSAQTEQPFYPISVAYWAAQDVFLVGSYADASIQFVEANGTKHRQFQPAYSDGRQHALRLSVDNTRQRLWVLDQDNVSLYALNNQQLLQKIALPSQAQCQPPLTALVLDNTGAAYLSGVNCTQIYRVDPNSMQVLAWGNVPKPLNALILNKSAQYLFGIAHDGSLWRIALANPQNVMTVQLNSPLPKEQTTVLNSNWLIWNLVSVQAMSWQAGSVLYLLHGTMPQLVKVELTLDEHYANVKPLAHTGFDSLMAGVYQNGFAYTPQADTHVAWYRDNPPFSPVWVRRVATN